MARPTNRTTVNPRRIAGSIFNVLDVLPVLLPVLLAGFGSVAVLFLLAGHFRPQYVWPAGLVAAGAAAWPVVRHYRPNSPGGPKERRLGILLAIVGVLAWCGFNAAYTSQTIFTTRDQATYAVAGQWLVHHENLSIPIPTVFGESPELTPASPGFGIDSQGVVHVYAQGQHLLPALLGLAGRISGTEGMLRLNVWLGGVALLAIYGFARLLVRPRWALTVTAALAASMPFIYFSRGTYSEVLATGFVFASLSLLWEAMRRRSAWPLWFVAGFAAGAAALTRIDAYLSMFALAVPLAGWLAFSKRTERQTAIKQAAALTAGVAVTGFLGWLDVSKLARPYYLGTRLLFYQELAGGVVLVVLGALFVYVRWHRQSLLRRIDRATKPWRQQAAALAVIAFAVLLSARPFVVWYLSGLNNASSVPYGHSYAEITTYWVAWYLGPLLAMLGVIGAAMVAGQAVMRRDLLLWGVLSVVGVSSVVYLLMPNITPDQVWASRRLVPVVLPGLAVLGGYALEAISERYFDRLRLGRWFAGLTAVAVVIGALFTTSPLVLLRDTTQLAPVIESCRILPGNAAVLLVGKTAQIDLMQPLHAFCGLPVMSYGGVVTPSRLASLAEEVRSQGKQLVIAVAGEDMADIGLPSTSLTSVSYSYRYLEHTYLNAPQHVLIASGSFHYGRALPDGTLAPL